MIRRREIEDRSPWLLPLAALLVGVAVVLSGPAAKAINGVAGVLWIAVAVALTVGCWSRTNGRHLVVVSAGIALVLVLLARPTDLGRATVGFAVGGAVLALTPLLRDEREALVLPALWLPVHLGTAVVRAAVWAVEGSRTNVRTDPPPTAALVPLVMVVAAVAGAAVVLSIRRRGGKRGATLATDRR